MYFKAERGHQPVSISSRAGKAKKQISRLLDGGDRYRATAERACFHVGILMYFLSPYLFYCNWAVLFAQILLTHPFPPSILTLPKHKLLLECRYCSPGYAPRLLLPYHLIILLDEKPQRAPGWRSSKLGNRPGPRMIRFNPEALANKGAEQTSREETSDGRIPGGD